MSNSPPPGPPIDATSSLPESASFSSVDNALRLLELAGKHQALRVAEVADILGVARSTAHRLLTALRQRDFLVQDRPNGAYRPGPALNAIGLAALARIDILRIARPVLHELRDQTRETITLAVLEGQQVRFIDSVESLRSVRVGNRTGVIRHAHSSAVGKAILASLPSGQLARLYPEPILPEATSTTITRREALSAELEEIRAVGYALNFGESSDGISAIAVALCDSSGYPIAGLGIAAPASRMGSATSMRAYAPDLEEAARRISDMVATER